MNDQMTVNEVAALLRVTPRTVRRYIDNGRLAAVRPPGTRRVYLRRAEVREAQRRTAERFARPRPENPQVVTGSY